MGSPKRQNIIRQHFEINENDDYDDGENCGDFDSSDPIYRVWCDCRIIPSFISILFVQFLVSFAAFVFSTYQIISIEHLHAREDSLNHTHAINTKNNLSTHFEIRFFLCQHWYPIIYVRFVILFCVLLCIFVALSGLQTANVRRIKIYIVSISIFVSFLLSYVALLAWHAIKNGDYFSFCFVGLTLFSMLLLNVTALHFAVVLTKFMRAREKFIQYAVEKHWINNANNNVNNCFSNEGKFWWNVVINKYELSDDLRMKARREINSTSNNGGGHRYRLCEIEEESEELK